MKIGALVPVRLQSERLPGKALMPLAGRPVIAHLLDRIAASEYITDRRNVVVCTTEDPDDDVLASVVEQEGCSIFRGSKDDIIARFAGAMRHFDFDAVIQADGDDPLSATEYMDRTMAALLSDAALDIVTVENVPLGTATKSFRRRGMDLVEKFYRTNKNDTGFIYFFTKSGLCRHLILQSELEHRLDNVRLTLDYQVDFDVFEKIFNALYRAGEVFSLLDTITFLKDNPSIAGMNLEVEKEYWKRTADKAVLHFEDEAGAVRKIEL